MQNYSDFPPCESFKRVLISSPQSALLFVALWKKKLIFNQNSISRLSVLKKEIKSKFLTTPTLFRNHLFSLQRLDLVTFEETSIFFLIDFHEDNES